MDSLSIVKPNSRFDTNSDVCDAAPENSAGSMLPPLHYTHFTAYTWNDRQAGLYLPPSRSVRCHECVLDDLFV